MAKTVEQIAKDLNLSVTTVRLVLGGKAEQYRISVKTQARINEHVERYGYTLNHSARSLKLNKTETLGLIVPNISNVFFATLAEKLELRCRRSGYQLMISWIAGQNHALAQSHKRNEKCSPAMTHGLLL
jgi:LacI family fructose operon transcriptional repressor